MPKPKSVSAGVIITDGDVVLLGHVTNSKHWDLPKGGVDPGESHLEAAVRELREETAIQCDPAELISLGVHAYKSHKDLALYVWTPEQMPDPKKCVCHSTFDGSKGKQPELDGFALVKWSQIERFVGKKMYQVLTHVQGVLEQQLQGDKS